MIEILWLISGFLLGWVMKNNFSNKNAPEMEKRLTEVEQLAESFPTPDELAREILRVKLPLNDIPEEVMDAFNKKVEAKNKSKEEIKSYTG